MMKREIEQVFNTILDLSTYSKDKSDKHGEVFTPPNLINDILNQFPSDVWSDPTKTWFDISSLIKFVINPAIFELFLKDR